MKIFYLFVFISSLAKAVTPFTVKNSTLSVKGNVHQLTLYNHELPPEVLLPPESKLISCKFAGKKCKGNPIVLKLTGTLPQNPRKLFLEVKYLMDGKKRDFRLMLFPDSFPELRQSGKSEINLPLIFSVSSLTSKKLAPCHLIILSPGGELQFSRSLDVGCNDFRPHRIGGELFYSYALVDQTISSIGYIGPRVILDKDFNEVKRVAHTNDMHDFLLLSLNHWVGFEFVLGRLSSGKVFLDKRLREWKDGKMIFDWGASDIIRQYGSEAATSILQTEYQGEVVAELFHMNAIQKISDRGFVVGLGHEGVAFLDRASKKLTWVLGGLYDNFNLRMSQHPLFNHTPYFDEKKGELTLFSNRSWGAIGVSPPRILRYQLNVDKKAMKSLKILRVKDEYVFVMGSLQLTGNYLSIGFGSKDFGELDFLEMHEDGKENWKLSLDKGRTVYRFYREPYGE
jgi:hypothetical protein